MARKNIIEKKILLNSSMGADVVSDPIYVGQCDHATIHAKWTGSPVGELIVEVNCLTEDESTWYQVDLSSAVSVSGVGEKEFIISIDHARIRLKYVRTSGTGTLNAEIHAKSIGA